MTTRFTAASLAATVVAFALAAAPAVSAVHAAVGAPAKPEIKVIAPASSDALGTIWFDLAPSGGNVGPAFGGPR